MVLQIRHSSNTCFAVKDKFLFPLSSLLKPSLRMSTSKWLLLLSASIVANASLAQQKQFTTADLLANKTPKNFYNTLPLVVKWVDDEHVILNQKIHPDSAAKNYVLDVKTGQLAPSASTAMPMGRGLGRDAAPTGGKSVYFK